MKRDTVGMVRVIGVGDASHKHHRPLLANGLSARPQRAQHGPLAAVAASKIEETPADCYDLFLATPQ